MDAGTSSGPRTSPPIAELWRRVAALAVDGLLLGVAGQALAWPLRPVWLEIGPYGRFVGFLIALAYFSLMDSRFGDGQTVGKRLLRIAIRDRDNQPIGVARSMLRTLIWLVPVTLNGWAWPLLRTPILAWLTGVIVFGVGGAILFTMVFNRRTRQGMHDMLCETYVVRLDGQPMTAVPAVARLQWVASGVVVALAAVLATVGVVLGPSFETSLENVIRLQRELEPDGRFFSVGVLDRTSYASGGNTSRTLRIEAWYKGMPSEEDRQRVINDLARAALDHMGSIDEFDQMQIGLTSAYDLGIASGGSTYGDSQPIDTWRGRFGGVDRSKSTHD